VQYVNSQDDQEARQRGQNGVKEINLIAQDLTAYGRDRKDGTTLYGLLRELETVPEVVWVRLLYSYPNFLDTALLKLIRDSAKICKYIDIPFQHISAGLLTKMRRGKSGSAVRETVAKLRSAIPELTLRTSLIVGFPGETEEDFEALLDFVEETRFERLGIFKYSEEEGTAAATMGDKICEDEKERRWQEVMDLQAELSRKNNEALIGSIQRVMIDAIDAENGALCGRTQGHAPEVDGVVQIEDLDRPLSFGSMIDVKITSALDYDLIGKRINA
jgi:ribosomal protein S12 methylthiotransferase